jgi:hypothetical protein
MPVLVASRFFFSFLDMFWICRWMSGSHVMVPTNILGVMVPTNILRGSVHVLEMRKRKVYSEKR